MNIGVGESKLKERKVQVKDANVHAGYTLLLDKENGEKKITLPMH